MELPSPTAVELNPEETSETVTSSIEQTAELTTHEMTLPSAPAIEEFEATENNKKQANPLYPNLKTLQSSEMSPKLAFPIKKERIVLQPFTSTKLKELYQNPEIALADAFEADFISTELNCAYKEHPLYELIKKYSQSRYNLKVNMLDLQGYIKSFQQNSQNVWIIENRVTSYEGMCADGERIRKNELYE